MAVMDKAKQLQVFAWGTSAVAVALSFIAWGESIAWRFDRLSSYSLFPLFGLIAFSLMWSHYVTAALRQYFKLDRAVTRTYFEITSFVVLAAIVLHPGLLIWQLWRDGYGLPPNSYVQHYVAPSLRWAAFLGSMSLLIFLVYELRRRFRVKSWWRYVQYASDAAIIAIFVHALALGGAFELSWFKAIWYVFGITLALSLAYSYLAKRTNNKSPA